VTINGSVDLKDDNQATADERAVAYHEAGHCVAAYRLRIPFTGRKALTIIPTQAYSGRFIHHCILKNDVEWNASDHNRLRMERGVQALLAGIEAQRRYDETSITYGEGFGNWDGGPDYHEAINLVSCFASADPKETELYMELLRLRTRNLIQQDHNWKCICALSDALMKRKVLSAKDAIAIIQGTIQNIVGPVPLIGPSTTSAQFTQRVDRDSVSPLP
jgi:hypothetical protein